MGDNFKCLYLNVRYHYRRKQFSRNFKLAIPISKRQDTDSSHWPSHIHYLVWIFLYAWMFKKVICFNPGLLVIWCFANFTTLTHSSFRKRFRSTICQEPFTEISSQMVSVPGRDFEYAPLSRPSLFHRLNNSRCIIHQRSYSISAF